MAIESVGLAGNSLVQSSAGSTVQADVSGRQEAQNAAVQSAQKASAVDTSRPVNAANAVQGAETEVEREQLEAAMLSVNRQVGGVSALVAGRDMRYSGFNRVLDTKRNIGSLVKPAVYLSALQLRQYHLGSVLVDEPVEVKDEQGNVWRPDNFDHQFRGELPLYRAFSNSINIPAVNLGLDIGVDKVANTLQGLGVESEINQYPSLLLGALELSSYEVAQLYTTLANDGAYTRLTSISSLTDNSGKLLYQHRPQWQQRFPEDAMYMTKYGMKRVTKDGTGKRLNKHF